MKSFVTSCVLAVVMGLLTGCSECRNDDCSPPASFKFVIVDPEGRALLGYTVPPKFVTNDSIQVLGIDDQLNVSKIDIFQDQFISQIDLDPKINNYVIDYSFTDDDSLFFDLSLRKDKCCGLGIGSYSVSAENDTTIFGNSRDSIYIFIKP